MKNKELQTTLKKFDDNLVINIASCNLDLKEVKNQMLDFLEIYENNFDNNELDDVKQINNEIFLTFSHESLIIPETYYFFLKWRENENEKLKKRLYEFLNTLTDNNIKTQLKDIIKESQINCTEYIDFKHLLKDKFNGKK